MHARPPDRRAHAARPQDPVKNGAALADLMSACPAELSSFAFQDAMGRARRVIPWTRVAAFQHVTLRLIAEQLMLTCAPDGSTPRKTKLRIPGEVAPPCCPAALLPCCPAALPPATSPTRDKPPSVAADP